MQITFILFCSFAALQTIFARADNGPETLVTINPEINDEKLTTVVASEEPHEVEGETLVPSSEEPEEESEEAFEMGGLDDEEHMSEAEIKALIDQFLADKDEKFKADFMEYMQVGQHEDAGEGWSRFFPESAEMEMENAAMHLENEQVHEEL